jgi:hypothetical protein
MKDARAETFASLMGQARAAEEATRSAAATYAARLQKRDQCFSDALALILEDPIDNEALADLCTQ